MLLYRFICLFNLMLLTNGFTISNTVGKNRQYSDTFETINDLDYSDKDLRQELIHRHVAGAKVRKSDNGAKKSPRIDPLPVLNRNLTNVKPKKDLWKKLRKKLSKKKGKTRNSKKNVDSVKGTSNNKGYGNGKVRSNEVGLNNRNYNGRNKLIYKRNNRTPAKADDKHSIMKNNVSIHDKSEMTTQKSTRKATHGNKLHSGAAKQKQWLTTQKRPINENVAAKNKESLTTQKRPINEDIDAKDNPQSLITHKRPMNEDVAAKDNLLLSDKSPLNEDVKYKTGLTETEKMESFLKSLKADSFKLLYEQYSTTEATTMYDLDEVTSLQVRSTMLEKPIDFLYDLSSKDKRSVRERHKDLNQNDETASDEHMVNDRSLNNEVQCMKHKIHKAYKKIRNKVQCDYERELKQTKTTLKRGMHKLMDTFDRKAKDKCGKPCKNCKPCKPCKKHQIFKPISSGKKAKEQTTQKDDQKPLGKTIIDPTTKTAVENRTESVNDSILLDQDDVFSHTENYNYVLTTEANGREKRDLTKFLRVVSDNHNTKFKDRPMNLYDVDVDMSNYNINTNPEELIKTTVSEFYNTTPELIELSNNIKYDDYVNGFKHYLKFQEELRANDNFSNLVKFQAHKHHKINDIGKFILEKLPQVPDTSRFKRRLFDDSYTLDDSEMSTKSDDSWFKKHFYIFLDNGPPKKFHTAQTVPLKVAVTSPYIMSTEKKPKTMRDEERKFTADEKTYLQNEKRDINSSVIENLNIPTESLTVNTEMPLTTVEHKVQVKKKTSLNMLEKLINRKSRKNSVKYMKDSINNLLDHRSGRKKRNPFKSNKKDHSTKEDHVNNKENKVTPPQKVVDEKQTGKGFGFVNVNIKPKQETAKAKVKKKHKLKNILHRLKFHRKTKKPQVAKRGAPSVEYTRVTRFHPLDKLKNFFNKKKSKSYEMQTDNLEDYFTQAASTDSAKLKSFDKAGVIANDLKPISKSLLENSSLTNNISPYKVGKPSNLDKEIQDKYANTSELNSASNSYNINQDKINQPTKIEGKDDKLEKISKASELKITPNEYSKNNKFDKKLLENFKEVTDIANTSATNEKLDAKNYEVKSYDFKEKPATDNWNIPEEVVIDSPTETHTIKAFQPNDGKWKVMWEVSSTEPEISSIEPEAKSPEINLMSPDSTVGTHIMPTPDTWEANESSKEAYSTTDPATYSSVTDGAITNYEYTPKTLADITSEVIELIKEVDEIDGTSESVRNMNSHTTQKLRPKLQKDSNYVLIGKKKPKIARVVLSYEHDEMNSITGKPYPKNKETSKNYEKYAYKRKRKIVKRSVDDDFLNEHATESESNVEKRRTYSSTRAPPDYLSDFKIWDEDILNMDILKANHYWQDVLKSVQNEQFSTPSLSDLVNEFRSIKDYIECKENTAEFESNITPSNKKTKVNGFLRSIKNKSNDLVKFKEKDNVKNNKLSPPKAKETNLFSYLQDEMKTDKLTTPWTVASTEHTYANHGNTKNHGFTAKVSAETDPSINRGKPTNVLHIEKWKRSFSSLSSHFNADKNKGTVIPKTTNNKVPRQFFAKPTPMDPKEFEEFLKANKLDVDSVTEPLQAMVSDIIAYTHKKDTIDKMYTSSLKSTHTKKTQKHPTTENYFNTTQINKNMHPKMRPQHKKVNNTKQKAKKLPVGKNPFQVRPPVLKYKNDSKDKKGGSVKSKRSTQAPNTAINYTDVETVMNTADEVLGEANFEVINVDQKPTEANVFSLAVTNDSDEVTKPSCSTECAEEFNHLNVTEAPVKRKTTPSRDNPFRFSYMFDKKKDPEYSNVVTPTFSDSKSYKRCVTDSPIESIEINKLNYIFDLIDSDKVAPSDNITGFNSNEDAPITSSPNSEEKFRDSGQRGKRYCKNRTEEALNPTITVIEGRETPKKRDASQVFTAKDVSSLEVIVDLLKDSNELSLRTTKDIPIKNDRALLEKSKNVIQIHIAVPPHEQLMNKREVNKNLKVRKVFKAKLLQPVDIQYQLLSFNENDNVPKPEKDLSPGLYYLEEDHDGKYILKPVRNQLTKDKFNCNNVKARTAESTPSIVNLTRPPKLNITKDFVNTIYKHLIELGEAEKSNTTTNLPTTTLAHVLRKRRKCSGLNKIKNIFNHDRTCSCRLKPNKTMPNACAASDEVISELVFEFNNLAKYMQDHCTEIQTFFWMNPTGGKKLRDTVSRVNKSLDDFYKRVKGKCHGRTCKLLSTCIEKRSPKRKRWKIIPRRGSKFSGVELISDLQQLKNDIDNFNVTQNRKLQGEATDFGIPVTKMFLDNGEISNKTNRPKTFYRLDKINVNIVCNGKGNKINEGSSNSLSTESEVFSCSTRNEIVPTNGVSKIVDMLIPKKPYIKILPPISANTEKETLKLMKYKRGLNVKNRTENIKNIILKEMDSIVHKRANLSHHCREATNEKSTTESLISALNVTKLESFGVSLKKLADILDSVTVRDTEIKTTPSLYPKAVREKNVTTKIYKITKENKKQKLPGDLKSTTKAMTHVASPSSKVIPANATRNAKTNATPSATTTASTNATSNLSPESPIKYVPIPGHSISPLNKTTTKKPSLHDIYEYLKEKIAEMKSKTNKSSDSNHRQRRKTTNSDIEVTELDAEDPTDVSYDKTVTAVSTTVAPQELSTIIIMDKVTAVYKQFQDIDSKDSKRDLLLDLLNYEREKLDKEIFEAENMTFAHGVSTESQIKTPPFPLNSDSTTRTEPLLLMSTVSETSTSENTPKEDTPKEDTPKEDTPNSDGRFRKHLISESLGRNVKTPRFAIKYKLRPRIKNLWTTAPSYGPQSLYDVTSPIISSFLNEFPEYGNVTDTTLADYGPDIMNSEFENVAIPAEREVKLKTRKLTESRIEKGTVLESTTRAMEKSTNILKVYIQINHNLTDPTKKESLTNEEKRSQEEESLMICDLYATMEHVIRMSEKLNRSDFEKYVKRINCHKFKKIPNFLLVDVTTKPMSKPMFMKTKVDRRMRVRRLVTDNVKDTRENIDSEDDNQNNDLATNRHFISDVKFVTNDGDYFDVFERADHGLYRKRDRERKKRTVVDLEELSKMMINLPDAREAPNEKTAIKGDTVTIECLKSGRKNSPLPIVWSSDGDDLLKADNVCVDGGNVKLTGVNSKNYGNYTCQQGAEVRTTFLNIAVLPTYRVMFSLLYDCPEICSIRDLRAVKKAASEMSDTICPKRFGSFMTYENPMCLKDLDSNAYRIRTLAVLTSVDASSVRCGTTCRRDIQSGMALLASDNVPKIAAIRVIERPQGKELEPTGRKGKRWVVKKAKKPKGRTRGVRGYSGLPEYIMLPGQVDIAVACPAGYYLDNRRKICPMCPGNSYSGAGSNACSACARGTSSAPGASRCLPLVLNQLRGWCAKCNGLLVFVVRVLLCWCVCGVLVCCVRAVTHTSLVAPTVDKYGLPGEQEPNVVKTEDLTHPRQLSPSRVVLSWLCGGKYVDEEKESKFELWKDRQTPPPPLPPVDFD